MSRPGPVHDPLAGASSSVLRGAQTEGFSGNLSEDSLSGDPFGLVGQSIQDTFFVEKVVAHGGFGVVYRANHLRFSAPVALKCLKIPQSLTAQERENFLERFLKEGEVMFRLSSTIPEVVRPLQVDSVKLSDRRLVPFIAFEWLNGETLKDLIIRRIDEGKPPVRPENGVMLLGPVARALARAHRFPSPAGPVAILHCDLKPDNVFVAEVDGGQVFKIFDFGIAKVRRVATRDAGGATQNTDSNMFTPAYAAPEQWNPDRFGQTGPWTDIFALALTLTELLTQQPAIDGTPADMLTQCLDMKKRPSPRLLGAQISDRLEAIFCRALAVEPIRRYREIEDFWSDLETELGLPVTLPKGQNVRGASSGPVVTDASHWDADALPERRPRSITFEAELEIPSESARRRSRPSEPPPSHSPPAYGSVHPAPSDPWAPAAAASPSPLGALDLAVDSPGALDLGPGVGPSRSLGENPSAPFELAQHAPPPVPAPMAGPSAPWVDPLARTVAAAGPPANAGERGWPAEPPGGFQGPHGPQGMQGAPWPAGEPQRASLAEVAARTGAIAASGAAGAAKTTALAAKTIAAKALEVDRRHLLRLDDPTTWVKPMLGPIVALGASVGITLLAVLVNKMTGANLRLVYISLPLFLASIGFAIYRFVKLSQSE